jgi:hypothetical protein
MISYRSCLMLRLLAGEAVLCRHILSNRFSNSIPLLGWA